MAEVRPLYLDPTDGFPTEIDTSNDSITLGGLTMNGDVAMGSNKITGLAAGTADTDAVNKAQLDALINGLDWKNSARLCADSDLGATFSAVGGANGKGQFTGAPTTVDGVAVAQGDRILVFGQTLGEENGIYVVTATTSTWDRADDFDDDSEVTANAALFVSEGATCGDNAYVLTTDDPITVNTTPLTFVQFNGAGSITAGDGLSKSGNTLNVNPGDGIVIDTDTVAIDLTATPGLEFSSGDLQVLVDPAGAILRQAAGISVNTGDGIEINANALQIDLAATNPGLQLSGGELSILLNPASGLDITAAGLAVDPGDGIAITGDLVVVDLATDPGLEFNAGDLRVLVDPAGAIDRLAAGLHVRTDDTTIQINGSNQLEVIASVDEKLQKSLTAAETIAVGDPVYMTTTNDNVGVADADVEAETQAFVGIALTAATATNPVTVATDGYLAGVLTGGGFSAGEPVYIASGGGLTDTRPSGAGKNVYYLGRAVNADDMIMQPQFLGKTFA